MVSGGMVMTMSGRRRRKSSATLTMAAQSGSQAPLAGKPMNSKSQPRIAAARRASDACCAQVPVWSFHSAVHIATMVARPPRWMCLATVGPHEKHSPVWGMITSMWRLSSPM